MKRSRRERKRKKRNVRNYACCNFHRPTPFQNDHLLNSDMRQFSYNDMKAVYRLESRVNKRSNEDFRFRLSNGNIISVNLVINKERRRRSRKKSEGGGGRT